jgi:uncharacterized membrane protein
VALTARLPKAIGYLMGLSGLGYIVQGWVLGSEGFSGTDTFAILGGYVLILAWIIWLVVVAWRTKGIVHSAHAVATDPRPFWSMVLPDIDLDRIEAIMSAQGTGSLSQPGGL